jgi:hypothetical protein
MGAASAPGRDASILSPLSQAFGADDRQSSPSAPSSRPLSAPSGSAERAAGALGRGRLQPIDGAPRMRGT